MRELRFVTRADDGVLLVESPDGLDQYRLPVDNALRAAVAGPAPAAAPGVSPARTAAPGAATGLGAPPAPPADPITPREIQVRVRAGESPQALADEQQMPLDRVLRFAGPVVAERQRIAGEARRARARRTGYEDTEAHIVQFGEAVDERFHAHGIDAEAVSWDSRRREDGEWMVVATWHGGEGTHDAQWLFHRGSRTVTPLDDTAADLLSDRPIRPVTPPAPEPPVVTAPPLAPGVIAFPPFPDAHTGPIPAVEEVFDQEDTRDLPRAVPPFVAARGGEPAAASSPASPVAPVPPVAAAGSALADFDEPPLPLAITDAEGRPAAAAPAVRKLGVARAESDDEKAARARIPSWDDILLGVRRKQD